MARLLNSLAFSLDLVRSNLLKARFHQQKFEWHQVYLKGDPLNGPITPDDQEALDYHRKAAKNYRWLAREGLKKIEIEAGRQFVLGNELKMRGCDLGGKRFREWADYPRIFRGTEDIWL